MEEEEEEEVEEEDWFSDLLQYTFIHSSHAYYTHQNSMPISHQISLEFVRRLSTTPITSPSSLAPALTYATALHSSTSNSCSTLCEKSIAWNKSCNVEIHLPSPTRASPRKEGGGTRGGGAGMSGVGARCHNAGNSTSPVL